MKTKIALTALTLVVASSAHAFEADFTGTVSMGLISSNSTTVAPIRTYTALDAVARLTLEVSGSVTVGLVVPIREDRTAGGMTISVSH
jgi:hypothetical protein